MNNERGDVVYIVLVYCPDADRYVVWGDYDDELDAVDSIAECGGILKIVEV